MGGGVQTTTIMLMAIAGEYPLPNHIIYADLGWDGQAVERNVSWLRLKATETSIPFTILGTTTLRDDQLNSSLMGQVLNPSRAPSMPFFTLDSRGNRGMLRRQCTNDYKIRPIDNYIRRTLLGLRRNAKCPPNAAALWLGISTDEVRRKVVAGPKWKNHEYPLLDLNMSRDDCHEWLGRNNYHHPARSSCIPCPYRSDAEWHYIKTTQPQEWLRACAFDEAIRNPQTLDAQLFLHQSRTPLTTVNFKLPNNGQPAAPRETECYGYCGT